MPLLNRRGHRYRGVAQFGRALRSGRRGREFESRHLDHKKPIAESSRFFIFSYISLL